MNPQEKAQELVDRYRTETESILMTQLAKPFALICADEIIEVIKDIPTGVPLQFWYDVKKEIEVL